jgi:O-methyltransferase involved in polyketide biosynthesis
VQKRTAEGVVTQRALNQTLDAAPEILDDPIASLLLNLPIGGNKANIAAS